MQNLLRSLVAIHMKTVIYLLFNSICVCVSLCMILQSFFSYIFNLQSTQRFSFLQVICFAHFARLVQ